MIGYLQGLVKRVSVEKLVIVVNGVGYEVNVTSGVGSKAVLGEDMELFIYTHVREEALELYGFKSETELTTFKLLIGVSGVGPKTAMMVMDRGGEAVQKAIIKADVGFFTTIPRLGQKNAQKIIIELKNKMGGMVDLDLGGNIGETEEVVEALKGMGYSSREINDAVKNIPAEMDTVDKKLRFILRHMGRR